MWIFLWTACCVAYPKNFWLACVGLFLVCGVCEFLTLIFRASDVCSENGCTLGYAAYCAIIAGITWFVTAGLCWKTALVDKANVYVPVSYNIRVTEYAQPDGTILTEKVTTRSNGTSVVERTVFIQKQAGQEEQGTDGTQEVIAGSKAPGVHTGVMVSATEESLDASVENVGLKVDVKKDK